MLSGVLNSDIAITVNIQIMRTFVEIRRLGLTTVDLRRKIDGMEKKYDHAGKAEAENGFRASCPAEGLLPAKPDGIRAGAEVSPGQKWHTGVC